MAQLLELEYKQWLFINRDFYSYFNCICSLKTKHDKQEAVNVIQHWFLVINEDESIPRYSKYPLLPKCTIKDEIAQKLVNAVVEKHFFWRNDKPQAENAVEQLLEYIKQSHDKYKSEINNLNPIVRNQIIIIGEFSCPTFENLSYLLENFSLIDITTMVLRYESLGNGSYQWGDPRELHFIYYKSYGVRYEGFASPINSRFISWPNCRFCSLFPDTDRKFGSLGNFFDVNLADYPGGWSVNPPFVNTVLEDASKKIIDTLKAGTKSTFFCTYPLWKDSNGWQLLENSRYTKRKFHRQNGCVIQDAYGKIFQPQMGLSLFCLSSSEKINFTLIEEFINKDVWIMVTK